MEIDDSTPIKIRGKKNGVRESASDDEFAIAGESEEDSDPPPQGRRNKRSSLSIPQKNNTPQKQNGVAGKNATPVEMNSTLANSSAKHQRSTTRPRLSKESVTHMPAKQQRGATAQKSSNASATAATAAKQRNLSVKQAAGPAKVANNANHSKTSSKPNKGVTASCQAFDNSLMVTFNMSEFAYKKLKLTKPSSKCNMEMVMNPSAKNEGVVIEPIVANTPDKSSKQHASALGCKLAASSTNVPENLLALAKVAGEFPDELSMKQGSLARTFPQEHSASAISNSFPQQAAQHSADIRPIQETKKKLSVIHPSQAQSNHAAVQTESCKSAPLSNTHQEGKARGKGSSTQVNIPSTKHPRPSKPKIGS